MIRNSLSKILVSVDIDVLKIMLFMVRAKQIINLQLGLVNMLYHSMITSHIRNCITTWCNSNKTILLPMWSSG